MIIVKEIGSIAPCRRWGRRNLELTVPRKDGARRPAHIPPGPTNFIEISTRRTR
jgi:hypothetical protein